MKYEYEMEKTTFPYFALGRVIIDLSERKLMVSSLAPPLHGPQFIELFQSAKARTTSNHD